MRSLMCRLGLVLVFLCCASLARAQPFSPLGYTGPISVTGTSAATALPTTTATGPLGVVITNTGSNTAYVALGNSAVVASTTNGVPLQAGNTIWLYASGRTHIAAIAAASTTTLYVAIGPGEYTLGSSSPSQTVPTAAPQSTQGGTQNANGVVAVQPDGSWINPSLLIGPLSVTSATNVIPATPTAGYASATVDVSSVGSGNTIVVQEDDGSGLWPTTFVSRSKDGCIVGNLGVDIYSFPVHAPQVRVAVTVYGSGTVASSLNLSSAPYQDVHGGNSAASCQNWPVVFNPTATSTFGIVPVVTTAANTAKVLSAVAANLYGIEVTSGATAGYALVLNAASDPGNGAVTPTKCYVLPANQTLGQSWNPPLRFGTGITVVFSSTGCFTETQSSTAFISGEAK